jgi:hypothetical protein
MATADFENGCTRDRVGEMSLTMRRHSFITSCENDSGGHVDGVDPISCVERRNIVSRFEHDPQIVLASVFASPDA